MTTAPLWISSSSAPESTVFAVIICFIVSSVLIGSVNIQHFGMAPERVGRRLLLSQLVRAGHMGAALFAPLLKPLVAPLGQEGDHQRTEDSGDDHAGRNLSGGRLHLGLKGGICRSNGSRGVVATPAVVPMAAPMGSG